MAADAWSDDRFAAKLQEMYFRKDAPSMREMAETLNSEFGTEFTRNACIGKCARMGLADRGVPQGRTVKNRAEAVLKVHAPRPPRVIQQKRRHEQKTLPYPRQTQELIKLRCVEIEPRLLTMEELRENDCRYIYGESVAEFRYCGHPRFSFENSVNGIKSSYCGGHYDLTRGQGTSSERAATKVAA